MKERAAFVEVVVTVAKTGYEEIESSTTTPKARRSKLASGRVVERRINLTAKTSDRIPTDQIIDYWVDDSAGVEVGQWVKVSQDQDGEFIYVYGECDE